MPGQVSAPPNLWDMGQAAKVQKTQQIDPLRGAYTGNNSMQLANQSREPGLQAQLGALGQYQAQALGQAGPSLAELQLQQQGQQQMGQALALSSRGRGGNIAGMAQQGLAAQQYGAQQLNAQQAQLRAAGQAQAQAAAAQLGGQLYSQGFGYDQLNQQGVLGADQNALGWYEAQRGMDLQRDAQNRQWSLGLIQAGAGAVGGLMGAASQMSDERVKQNVRPSDMNASRTVGALDPQVFEYEPGYGAPGERVGIMAQQLERTPLGASLVQNTPYGKTVENGGLASLGVAAASENTHEIAALKQQVEQLTGLLGIGSHGGGSTVSQQYVRNGLGA
jgi:hypothetical protein